MKRVLNGVHILMAIGLVVALAACGGSDGSLRKERDQAQAAAAAAEADKMAAEAAAAQAAADKMAADEAAAQAAAEKMAAEAAAAQAEADKIAAEAAAALAEADKIAAEAAAALAEAEKMAAEAAKMAAEAAAAQAEAEKMAAEAAAALAEAEKMAADEAAAQAEAEKMAADEAAAQAEAEKMAAEQATALAEAARIAAEAAAAQAEADKLAAEEALALAVADKEALEPSADELARQAEAAATKGAQAAFGVLAKIPSPEDDSTSPTTPAINRKADSTLKVSHDGMAVKFSASGPEATDPAWTKAATDMALPIPNWASDTLTSKLSTTETGTGLVYSNIEEASYKLFAVEHDGRTASLADAAAWTNAVIAPGNKYTGGADAGSIPGSFQGADGTFKCSGGSCADIPTRKSDGKLSAEARGDIAGEWIFEPTAEDAMVKLQDVDYLMFGYWLSKDKTGPKQFQVWYGGGGNKSDVGTTEAVAALDEKVTYNGAAAGKYVTKDDVDNTAKAGYFTATAVLTADFSVLAGPHGKLTGTISDFKEGDSAPLDDLKLSLAGDLEYFDEDSVLRLNTTDRDHDGDGDTPFSTNNAVMAESNGLKHGPVGGWEAQLFGSEKNTNIPTGVAGAFNAEIPDQAVVVGSFGATK